MTLLFLKHQIMTHKTTACTPLKKIELFLQYLPPVDGRARCGYVGLRNGGATCYMNSVIQQLFMTPGVPESVLGVQEDQPDEER